MSQLTQQKDKILLGVDPGTNILGYAVIGVKQTSINLMDYGVLNLKKKNDHPEKLEEIYLGVQEVIERHGAQELSIETPFYSKNVQSMLKLGRARGVPIAAAITMGLEIFEYSPKKIKKAITGNGNASKEQVAAMLENILSQKLETKYLDATDALATVICHHFQSGIQQKGMVAGKGGWAQFARQNVNRILK